MKVQNYEVADFWLGRNPPPIHYESQIGLPGIYMEGGPVKFIVQGPFWGHYESRRSLKMVRRRPTLPPNYYEVTL